MSETSLSHSEQLLPVELVNLPQFVEIDAMKANGASHNERLDELRTKLDAAMNSSTVNDCSGLISLKDILRKEKSDTDKLVSEQYLMISSAHDDGSDGVKDKDRQIIV